MPAHNARQAKGFTLMELLVVLAIIGLLLSVAVPHYFGSLDRSKESVLKHDLVTMRDAIDKFYGDTGRYPDDLAELTFALANTLERLHAESRQHAASLRAQAMQLEQGEYS